MDEQMQFESTLCLELRKFLSFKHNGATTYGRYKQANGMLERWHQLLKAHYDSFWSQILPFVLLGLRIAAREEFAANSGGLV